MKIAIGQINMGFEEKEQAMLLCSRLLAEAGQRGADFVVFPEMTLVGFTLQPALYGEERENSRSIAFFQQEAKKHALSICFGLPIHENGVSTNHCIIIDATGSIVADYAKIHPFSYGAESKHYIGGDRIASCEIDGVCLTPFVCYDLRFPELFQIASEHSLLISVIANWPISRREHWMTLLKARAIETQSFLIGVNRSGEGGGLSYCGDSMVVSPTGEVLAHVIDGNGLTYVDIDPSEAIRARDAFPLKADRKPELYHALWAAQH